MLKPMPGMKLLYLSSDRFQCGTQKINNRRTTFVFGNKVVNLLDQTGQDVVGLSSKDHDDRSVAERSGIAEFRAKGNAVVDAGNLDHLKRAYLLARQ